MESNKVYNHWIERRRQVAVPNDFSGRVMAQLHGQTAIKQEPWWRMPFYAAQWLVAISMVMAGLFRLTFVAVRLLVP